MTHEPRLTVVVPAFGPDRVIAHAVAAVLRQTLPDIEAVVVHEARDADAAPRRLAALAAGVPTRFVSARGLPPGVWRNDGLRASRSNYVAIVDGAEDLAPTHFERALAALAAAPEAAFAAATGPFTASLPPDTDTLGLPYLLASPWAVCAATVIERTALDGAGFDESLPDLVDWDLLLTLASAGCAGVAVRNVAAPRFSDDDVRLRESLRAERHLPAVRRLLAKHREAFARHAPDVLAQHEVVAKRLWATTGLPLTERRERLSTELSDLRRELASVQTALRAYGRDTLEWNDLRRTTPISRNWGLERGRPVDRHYIEGFLAEHAADVRGTVLEVLDAGLTHAFGGDRVQRSDVLDIDPGNRRATVIADLRAADQLPADTYDCFILTQTLHLLDDMPAAVAQAYRTLKPGGVLLVTLPCASMVAEEYGSTGDHWRLTEAGARYVFEQVFPPAAVETRARGNVLATTAFLYGLSCGELQARELDVDDPAYATVITVRAVKPAPPAARLAARERREPVVLLYHQVAERAYDHHGLAVAPDVFRAHMQHLAAGWHPMSLGALAAAAAAGDAPEGAVAVAFDDGYLDNLEVALPILAECGVPATFFFTSERLDARRRYWWDVLEATFLTPAEIPPSLTLRLAGETRTFDTHTETARQHTHDQVYAYLKASPPVVRDDVLRQLPTPSAALDTFGRPMVADELRTLLHHPLVTVGAHSVHHPSLPTLGAEALHREVFECRSALERVTGLAVDLFAYPFGDVSPEAVEMLRAADYRFAVTTDNRPVRRADHPLRVPRLAPPLRRVDAFADWLLQASGSGCAPNA